MKVRVITWLVSVVARAIVCSLRLTVIGEDQAVANVPAGEGVILATWHGRTFIPITRFRGRGYWSMISTSKDGEYQNRLFERFGFHTVRGSTSARGAVACALTMAKQLRNGAVLAHTPDGPRGPLHVVHQGAIFLAQKSGVPIVPAGISANPRLLLSTWDQYLIPAPFARAALIFGDPIRVPKDLDENGRAIYAERLRQAIIDLEAQAESHVCRLAPTNRVSGTSHEPLV